MILSLWRFKLGLFEVSFTAEGTGDANGALLVVAVATEVAVTGLSTLSSSFDSLDFNCGSTASLADFEVVGITDILVATSWISLAFSKSFFTGDCFFCSTFWAVFCSDFFGASSSVLLLGDLDLERSAILAAASFSSSLDFLFSPTGLFSTSLGFLDSDSIRDSETSWKNNTSECTFILLKFELIYLPLLS